MGKQKRQRNRPHKQNPTGLVSVQDFEIEEIKNVTNENREHALERVYEEVQSANVKEKLSGLQTIESMSCNSALALQIAKDGIAKLIGPLLVDKNVLVRASSANALRCIAHNGKTEVYASLLKDDIMTPLCTLLNQYYKDWQPNVDHNKKNKIAEEKEAFIQAVTLLWLLCEHSEFAIKSCDRDDIMPILTKFFDITTYGIEIATVTTQCLTSLTENNPVAVKKFQNYKDTLIQLLNIEIKNTTLSEVVCFKTAISSLLINLINRSESNSVNIVYKVINVLSNVLSIDCKQLLSNLASILSYEKNAFSNNTKKMVQENRRIFSAQQQALEIIANLCSEDQENGNESDLEDSDYETEDIDDVYMDAKLCKSLPLEMVEVFNTCSIVNKVWNKTRFMDKDITEILQQNAEGKDILKQVHTLKCTTYLCLNNLILSLEVDALGGVENIYRMWMDIGRIVFKDTNPNDIDLLESTTAAMRAAIQRLSEEKTNIFNQLTLADIQPILNGERQCSNTNVRVNLIRTLGTLALILMNNNTPEVYELIKYVSTFLLDICITESSVWVIAESLDAIMDIYAEDNSDQLANEIKLVEKLHTLVPLFKNKMKQQRKNLGDNVAIVSTVNINIIRFIKYKEKRFRDL